MKIFISAFEINCPLDLTNLIAYCSRASGTRGAWGGARSTQILGSIRSKKFSFKSTSIYFCPLPDYWTFRRHWVLPSFLWCYPSLGILSVFSVFFDSTQFSATDLELKHVQEDHDRLMERHSALLTVSEHLLIFEQAVVVKTQNFWGKINILEWNCCLKTHWFLFEVGTVVCQKNT